jgi:quinol monooxygenase YgiN
MLALIVEFRIKPSHVADFERAMLENARASRETEPGCRQFDVCRDPDDACAFVLYELYDDEAAIDCHTKTAHYRKVNEVIAGWVETKKLLRYRRIAP